MGFNPGSTLGSTDLRISVIAVNTNLAAVAGSASAMFLWYYLFGKPDITMACNGMLAGLVAITAPCAFVSPSSAVMIGILAGILVDIGVLFNERVIKVDDPCGAISVHGYCGWNLRGRLERRRRSDLSRKGGPRCDRYFVWRLPAVFYASRRSYFHGGI